MMRTRDARDECQRHDARARQITSASQRDGARAPREEQTGGEILLRCPPPPRRRPSRTAVQRRRGDLIELSHSIHAEPELAFDEHRSCAKTQALVAERGFEITAAPGGLDTAFRAELRQRVAGHRGLRGVRRAAWDRTCVRAQHHRGVRGGHGAGVGRRRRRARPHRRAARHARRGGWRRKGVDAQRRARSTTSPPR